MPSLLADAVPGALAYDAVSTQWRRAGMGGQRTGLDYAACLPVLQGLLDGWAADGHALQLGVAELLDDVQVMEAAILEVDMERAEHHRGNK